MSTALSLTIAPNATTTMAFPSGAVYQLAQFLTQAEANGVTVLVVTAVISLVSVIGLLIALALSAFNTRFSSNDQLFVRTHVATYFVSLLICEILQAIGAMMSAKWVQHLEVFVGPFCTAQAIIKQTADVGAATWSFILALHTFFVLFLEWKIPSYVRWLVLVVGWGFIGTLDFAGPASVNQAARGPFHGVSGFWCWINNEYHAQRLALDYLIIFFSLMFSFILYLLVFLRLRGNIVINGTNVQFRSLSNAKKRSWSNHNFQERQILIIARQMLWYPVAYTAIVFPIGLMRLASLSGHAPSFSVTIFCDVIYLLSGFINVVLFCTTRSVIPRRSVLKFVISRPTVMEPDYAEDPDDYYPDMDDGEKGTNMPVDAFYGGATQAAPTPRVLDIEKMGADTHHDNTTAYRGPPTAKSAHPPTPIFRRDSSYHSDAGSELDDHYERRVQYEGHHDVEAGLPPHSEHPGQLVPGHPSRSSVAPHLSMPNNALIASRTMLPSPEDDRDMEGDFYDLYEERSPNPNGNDPQTPHAPGQRRLSHGQMHDVSLE